MVIEEGSLFGSKFNGSFKDIGKWRILQDSSWGKGDAYQVQQTEVFEKTKIMKLKPALAA